MYVLFGKNADRKLISAESGVNDLLFRQNKNY